MLGVENQSGRGLRDKRIYERFALGAARGKLLYNGSEIACEAVDISMGGCCLRTEVPFEDGALALVEVALAIDGLSLHIGGVTQWTSSKNSLVGVRFTHPSARSRNQLAALLTCLLDKSAAEVVQQALAAVDSNSIGKSVLLPDPETVPPAKPLEKVPEPVHAKAPAPEPRPAVQYKSAPQQDSDIDESPAVLHVLSANTELPGTVLNLSPAGCIFKTAKPFLADIRLRVELRFQLRGLPLQLAAVVEDLYDKQTFSIRFLDLSRRKQEELAEVIEELRAHKQSAEAEA